MRTAFFSGAYECMNTGMMCDNICMCRCMSIMGMRCELEKNAWKISV